ncbi:hypothetical protein ACQ4M3_18990 [Leptolyngbya sp. AN03gr2]|uniref:hypothetical protein n=1 Tax=Leptolyngbya sp. AN03gr2 TaxID=3423364 RepID=UPI003D310D57
MFSYNHIFLIDSANPSLEIHHRVVESLLKTERYILELQSESYAENPKTTTGFRKWLLAQALSLTIQSVSSKDPTNKQITEHARRFWRYKSLNDALYPNKLNPNFVFGSHLGSLGVLGLFDSEFQSLSAEMIHALLSQFWKSLGLDYKTTPRFRYQQLLSNLEFDLSYLRELEQALGLLYQLERSKFTKRLIGHEQFEFLPERVLLGEVYTPLVEIATELQVRCNQSEEDRNKFNLPVASANKLNQFLARSLSVGYSAGFALVFQCFMVESYLSAYEKLDPTSQTLSQFDSPLELAETFVLGWDAAQILSKFETTDSATRQEEVFRSLTAQWLTLSGNLEITLQHPNRLYV